MTKKTKSVGRRLSVALFDQAKKEHEQPDHHKNLHKQQFITDVHLEAVTEIDPLDDIVKDISTRYHDELLSMFQYYCSYGEPYNLTLMKMSSFVKFVRTLEYLPKSFPLARLQVFFKHAVHHYKGHTVVKQPHSPKGKGGNRLKGAAHRAVRLDYTRWLYALCLVVKFKRKKVTKDPAPPSIELCVQVCLEQNVFPKADRLNPLPNADLLMDDQVVQIMRDNTAMLMKVYSHYGIPCGTMNEQLYLNEDGLKRLFAEFTMPQSLLGKLEMFRIWNNVSEHAERVQFPEFLEIMGRAALIAYSKPYLEETHPSTGEKVSAFLELFRYHEKLRLIIEEHRQLGKQVNYHKLSRHQIMGKAKLNAQQKWRRLRLYHKFGRTLNMKDNVEPVAKMSEVVKLLKSPSMQAKRKLASAPPSAKKLQSKEWAEDSSHLMGSTTASSIFSPMWKKYRPLEIAVGALQPYRKSLMEVFEYYCFFNNRGKLNFTKMDSFSWIKLLLDCELIDNMDDARDVGAEGTGDTHPFITRAEGDVIYMDILKGKKSKTGEKPGLTYDGMLMGLARVTHILEHRAGNGLRFQQQAKTLDIKSQERMYDYKQLSSPRQKEKQAAANAPPASPDHSRRGSMYLNWSPSSPSTLRDPAAKRASTESTNARASRLLKLLELNGESMSYLHFQNHYREQIVNLAEALIIVTENYVLCNAKRVSCYGYGEDEADLALNLLNEDDVVALIQEQEITLQRIFTHFSSKRHMEKPFYHPKEDRSKAMEFKELECFASMFKIVPSLLTRTELFMCFRASRRNPAEVPSQLNYSEWVECFARMGLLAFSKPFLAEAHPLPEHRLHGMFGWIRASEGMMTMERYEWSRGHGYGGVKMTTEFLKGEPKRGLPDEQVRAEAHELVYVFNLTMQRIRDIAAAISTSGKTDLKTLFTKFDEDGDGTISKEEFFTSIITLCGGEGCGLTHDDIDQVYKVLDPDKSNSVSYGEFMYQFYNRRSVVKQLRSESDAKDQLSSSGLLTIDAIEVDESMSGEGGGWQEKEESERKDGSEKGTPSVIAAFRPIVYNLGEMMQVQRRFKNIAHAWIGKSLHGLEAYLNVKGGETVQFQNLSDAVDKMSEGTIPDNRLVLEDVKALFHMLSDGDAKPVRTEDVRAFLTSPNLMEWPLERGPSEAASPRVRFAPAVVTPKKPPQPPTMEEMVEVLSAPKQRKEAPRSGEGRRKGSGQGRRAGQGGRQGKGGGRRAVGNLTTPTKAEQQQQQIVAPRLFLRSPGEMKYLKRVRAATKEKERVRSMTDLRVTEIKDGGANRPKGKVIIPESIRRGSYFGTYDHSKHVKKVATGKARRLKHSPSPGGAKSPGKSTPGTNSPPPKRAVIKGGSKNRGGGKTEEI